ncbi:MAG: glycerate kinase [Lachnospiraceae bacterium]
MKVVIAIDSFKGSLTSLEAGEAIKEGILNATEAEIIIKPLADGGEGTTEALIEGLSGEAVRLCVKGPLGNRIEAAYGYIEHTKTAVIEMAAAAGIVLVKEREKNPMEATTYGVGEMIKDAIGKGCRDFIIGIGGSATNDGGIGMLTALGYEFFDEEQNKLGFGGKDLGKISFISDKNAMPELKECHFKVACDVTNPLCGANGATYVYGPQKGVTKEMLELLDHGMGVYAEATKKLYQEDYTQTPGAGAAGGLGFAFLSYLKGELYSGVDLVVNALNLEESIKDADYVITGEGRIDFQTAMGKAPVGVGKLAKKYGAVVIALAGCVAEGAEKCNEAGIDSYYSILTNPVSLEEAMEKKTARSNLVKTTEQIFRLIASVKHL